MISTDTPANVIESDAKPNEWLWALVRRPRGAALGLVAAYLAGSGALLALGGYAGAALSHAAGVALTFWLMTSRARWARVGGDLFPLFIMPILYAELPLLIAAAGSRYHDSTVQGWEATIFGAQPSHMLASALPWQWLSELLHTGYLAYYPMIFAPALVLYRRGERSGMSEVVMALTATYVVCWVTFITIPVEGPRYLWTAPLDVPSGPVRRFTLDLLAAGSSRGAAFPSSHMAIAMAVAVMSFRWLSSHAWLYSVVALSIGVGAVYGGFHYGVDMLAGALVGGLVAAGVIFSFSKRRASAVAAE